MSSIWLVDEVEKDHHLISAMVQRICDDIASRGERTRYPDIYDMIYEQIDDKNMHIKEGDYYD